MRTLLVAAALFGTVLVVAAPAPAVGTCSTKPAVYPVSQVHKGQTGTGLTTVEGSTPSHFDYTVLGVQPDGIAPGLDLILVKLTGPVIDRMNGIVEGMSGSPVYLNGKLLGSTSYGFFPANNIAGVTPAEEMIKLFDFGPPPEGSSSRSDTTYRSRSPRMRSRVTLSASLRRTAARAAGTNESSFPSSGSRLRIPLAVSGAGSRGIGLVKKFVRKHHLPFRAYAAASAPASSTISAAPLQPGDSFAAALSYGDATFAGIGTTTATCGNLALAWGHPFLWGGATQFGMSDADVLTVIPNDVIPGFKYANITDLHGTVDQDRLEGIRGQEGVIPPMTPITSSVTNPDLPKSRNGESDVVDKDYMPIIAAIHLLVNQDVAFDRVGDGTVSLGWQIHGTDEHGQPFTLRRDNKYFSNYDVSYSSIFELYAQVYGIQNNPYQAVSIDSVQLDDTITQRHVTTRIVKVLAGSSLQPQLRKRKSLSVRPGDTIFMRVFLLPHGKTVPVPVTMLIPVPKRISSSQGELAVRGGQSSYCGFSFRGSCKASSFADFIKVLQRGEHNYDLVGQLTLGGGRRGFGTASSSGGGGSPPSKGGGRSRTVKRISKRSHVVLGGKGIQIYVRQPTK